MRNKPIWKLLAISIALVMVGSCAAPGIDVDTNSTNSTSRKLNPIVFKVPNLSSNKITALTMKKWTKIGAVVGGIWGLLALPITLLCIIFGPSIPDSVGMILFDICYLPFRLIAKMITLPSSMAFVVGINFIGWVLIGATIGYLYGLILGDTR